MGYHVFLDAFRLEFLFFSLSLIDIPLVFFKIIINYFVDCASIRGSLNVNDMYASTGRIPQCFSLHAIRQQFWFMPSIMVFSLITWLKWSLRSFPTERLLIFPFVFSKHSVGRYLWGKYLNVSSNFHHIQFSSLLRSLWIYGFIFNRLWYILSFIFMLWLFPVWPMWASSRLLLGSSDITPIILWIIPYLLGLNIPGLSCTSSTQPRKSAICPGVLFSISELWSLEAKI